MAAFLFYLFVFFIGLTVGSFLNSVIYRLEKNERFLKGRSYCPHCKKLLAWHDLIPFLSFLLLGGRCRYCFQKISWQYPLVELATGIIFLFIAIFLMSNNYTPVYLFYIVISCFLIVIFVYDLKHYIIPDKIIYPAIALTLSYQLFALIWNLPAPYHSEGIGAGFGIWNLEFGILKPILSAILALSFFLAIVLLSKGRWMGVGDIKLAFLMGLFLSWPKILVALFLAFISGAIIGIGLIAKGSKTLKSEVPFGPFLVAGTFAALFWGEGLVNWYLGLISS